MLMHHKTRSGYNPVIGAYTLTRHNLEVAAIVVYFFALAVFFAFTFIVMLIQTGHGSNP